MKTKASTLISSKKEILLKYDTETLKKNQRGGAKLRLSIKAADTFIFIMRITKIFMTRLFLLMTFDKSMILEVLYFQKSLKKLLRFLHQ